MLLLLAQSFRAYWCELIPQFFHRILRPLDLKRGDVVERLEMKGEERKLSWHIKDSTIACFLYLVFRLLNV